MSSSRRGFLAAFCALLPAWMVGRGVMTSSTSVSDVEGLLRKHLLNSGYLFEDADLIARKFYWDGLGAAVDVVNDWDDETHNYTGELCDTIHEWRFHREA